MTTGPWPNLLSSTANIIKYLFILANTRENFDFLISENNFWYKKMIFWYQKLIFWYQKMIFLYQKFTHFLISEIDFLISENHFLISEINFWYQKIIFWYQKISIKVLFGIPYLRDNKFSFAGHSDLELIHWGLYKCRSIWNTHFQLHLWWHT